MSRSQQRNRLEQRDLQVHDGKLPEISCIPECRPIASQPPKGQKLPILKSDQRLLGNKVSGKSFESRLFENSWKNAVIKTKRMKQEYISAYGLRDCDENAAMPSLAQAIPNTSPIAQKTQSATKPFPSSNDDPSLPHLYVLPSTSSQCVFESFYKSREDIAMGDIKKRVACTWKTGPLKTSEMHGGAGELGAVRLKKYNRCSSLISFPEGSKFKTGYRFTDPVSGAPPQYLQRLSELAALECETIHQEKSRKIRRTKKQEM
ncbi:putative uncharacterized protein C8orf89 homolog isoform X1 [Rhineura floridana]|uniref:putative uncharacterized protein C8orf89 homolog isoform X1 n=1 Tax=Rhineura floridana TaxID=261503 RepID=UPI002AC84B8C|nr:putative uncharacterized protein C8orf89 homolog isoform X1 [Rhineura floridana]